MPDTRDTVLVDAEALRHLEEAVATLRTGGGEMSFGELSAIRDRLHRIVGNLSEIFPPSDAPVAKRSRRRGAPSLPNSDSTMNRLLAECRLSLDHIERTLAARLPRRSSGVPADGWRFHGKQRVGKGQGDAIRADYHQLGEEATLKKWCMDSAAHKSGVPDGVGPFTKMQVSATLSHARGGHLRK